MPDCGSRSPFTAPSPNLEHCERPLDASSCCASSQRLTAMSAASHQTAVFPSATRLQRSAPAIRFHGTACVCAAQMRKHYEKKLQLRDSVPYHALNSQSLDVHSCLSTPPNLSLIPESTLFGVSCRDNDEVNLL